MVTRMWNFTQKTKKRNPVTNPRKANWNCNMVKNLGDAPHYHCLATGHDMQSWTSGSQKRTLISKLKPPIKPFYNIIQSTKPGSPRLARCFQTNATSRLMMATERLNMQATKVKEGNQPPEANMAWTHSTKQRTKNSACLLTDSFQEL